MKRLRPGIFFISVLWLAAPLEVSAQSPVHHWIFEGGTADIVGGADAMLINGATITDHTIVLDGVDDYIDLPIDDTIASLKDFTVLGWWTCTLCGRWARFFDFGAGTQNYMMLATSSFPTNAMYYAIEAGNVRQDITGPKVFPDRKEICVAVSFSSASTTTTVYVFDDIPFEFSSAATSFLPSDLGATSNWIGRSQFPLDPYFGGNINELRIYDESLNADTIGNICSAGPVSQLVFEDSFETE